MTIHYFSPEPWEEGYVRSKLPSESISFHPSSLAAYPELSDTEAEALCVFVDSPVGESEMARFPALKLIATRSTGYDHIDIAAAAARGIAVANVPSYGENTVAEFTFALILALSRKIIDADERVRMTGTFSQEALRGFDLAGKTLGVVGCGHIGMQVIRMAQGFSMNVIGFDAHPDENRAKESGFAYAALENLLAASDIVTLHVPYLKETHHLINKSNIGRMKKGSYLINTARGAVLETDALVEALKSGIIAGAALDVLEEEGEMRDELALLTSAHPNEAGLKTALENHYLINHPSVIVTPHVAFDTLEAVQRIIDTSAQNLYNFAAGAPSNVVGA